MCDECISTRRLPICFWFEKEACPPVANCYLGNVVI
jgi:hypothetical protein